MYRNVYTISSDTKIVSKILEIHLFPKILEFARALGYRVVLADYQNYYPDISFVKANDENTKFAVDFKTTYRNANKDWLCNGFTLGSHGRYFEDRGSTKNIQFPYSSYMGHFCLGIIYDRIDSSAIDETKSYTVDQLQSIASVVKNFQFLLRKNGRLRVTRAVAAIRQTLAASIILLISLLRTECSQGWASPGLMIIG